MTPKYKTNQHSNNTSPRGSDIRSHQGKVDNNNVSRSVLSGSGNGEHEDKTIIKDDSSYSQEEIKDIDQNNILIESYN